jgi:hypothetical protein
MIDKAIILITHTASGELKNLLIEGAVVNRMTKSKMDLIPDTVQAVSRNETVPCFF